MNNLYGIFLFKILYIFNYLCNMKRKIMYIYLRVYIIDLGFFV